MVGDVIHLAPLVALCPKLQSTMSDELASIQGRLYLLTKLATFLQISFESNDNFKSYIGIESRSSKGSTTSDARQAKLLNHLAVLLSRGGEDLSGVVAVYAGPLLAKKLTAVVVRCVATICYS